MRKSWTVMNVMDQVLSNTKLLKERLCLATERLLLTVPVGPQSALIMRALSERLSSTRNHSVNFLANNLPEISLAS